MTDPYRQFNDPDEANRVGEDLQTRAVARATRPYVDPVHAASECYWLMRETMWNQTVSDLVATKHRFMVCAFTRASEDLLAFRRGVEEFIEGQITAARAGARECRERYDELRKARS